MPSTTPKRRRRLSTLCSASDVNAKLLDWFINAEDQLESVSGDILLVKANETSRALGYEVPITMSWLNHWKARHSIKFKTLHGEGGAVIVDMTHEWNTNTLPLILSRYELKDIYNADEADLAWRQQPEGTHTFRSMARKGNKMSKERVTMLVATNADGTDKLPLLVIVCNKSAWMMSSEFNSYIVKLDQKMRAQNRKIALIIDNVGTHKLTHVTLTNIEVFYSPPNTTSMTQPMDNGIIRSLKSRKRLARNRLRAFEAQRQDHRLLSHLILIRVVLL